MDADDAASPEFWSCRYVTGSTPSDLQGVPPALHAFLQRSGSRGRALIPGCGSGYEVRAFHDAGYDVTALDFSSAAVNRARALLGALGDKVQVGDFFHYEFPATGFDLVYERTFLCALSPSRWAEYAARMADLLRDGGRLVGVFVFGTADDGPPFPLPEGGEQELFTDRFELTRSEALPASLPVFDGMEERWQEWRRLP
ncbi:MAG TPA: methyltransferase domain-containing protein [Chthoniobacterales bacterium]|nr:methyltransferase domain-containing protein [Chthoniobacterales bacterium]